MPFKDAESARAAAAKSHATRAARKKSGDSLLQDGHAAREANRKEIHPDSRELPAMLQDAAEQKRASGASEVTVSMTEASYKLMVKNLELMEKRVRSLEGRPPVVTTPSRNIKCGVCMQVSPSVCDGTHVAVMVAPKSQEFWRHFQGVIWNGVRYAGRCLLPVSIADPLVASIGRWEANERKLYIPGGKVHGEYELGTAHSGRTAII